MEYLFENPIPMLMLGAVLLTFMGVLYYTTRSIGAFIGLVLVAVLTLSAVVVEQIVYTDREMIEVALTGITNAMEENDQQGVLNYLTPTATETRKLVNDLMPKLTITKANILSELAISFDDDKHPTRATVKFRGFFHARHQNGFTGADKFPVEVDLVKDLGEKGGRWHIESFRSEKNFKQQAAKLMK